MTSLRTAVAQLGDVVGDVQGNAERVAEAMGWAESASADVLVLPELGPRAFGTDRQMPIRGSGADEPVEGTQR